MRGFFFLLDDTIKASVLPLCIASLLSTSQWKQLDISSLSACATWLRSLLLVSRMYRQCTIWMCRIWRRWHVVTAREVAPRSQYTVLGHATFYDSSPQKKHHLHVQFVIYFDKYTNQSGSIPTNLTFSIPTSLIFSHRSWWSTLSKAFGTSSMTIPTLLPFSISVLMWSWR